MNAMFVNCKTLKAINLSSFNTENLKDISTIFLGCDKLKNTNLYLLLIQKISKI